MQNVLIQQAPASGGGSHGVCEGRLTLESGVAVSITDQTAKTTVYFTPFRGNKIGLYDGASSWAVLSFSELSASLSGLTANTNYDVFAYNNAGSVALDTLVAWTNDTTRATALVLQDGVPVKSGATTRRYLGTVRMSATGQTQIKFGGIAAGGSEAWVGIWNAYNRVETDLFVGDSTDNWTYTTATWRSANNSATMRCSFVSGLAEDGVQASYAVLMASSGGSNGLCGLGLDSTSALASRAANGTSVASGATSLRAELAALPVLGFHYVQAIERSQASTGTNTYYGDAALPGVHQNGLMMQWRY